MVTICWNQIEFVNSANLRSADFPRQLHLLAESAKCLGRRCDVLPNRLEGHAAKLQVFGFIYIPHPAAADGPDDAKAAEDDFT